jgi:hypothetical protein
MTGGDVLRLGRFHEVLHVLRDWSLGKIAGGSVSGDKLHHASDTPPSKQIDVSAG